MKYLKILITFSLIYQGCAGSSVSINRHYDFNQIKRIAVFDFESYTGYDNSGAAMASTFESALLRAGYNLVEREKLKKLMDEQNFNLSGAVEPRDAIELGRILGVQALVFGKVTVYSPHEKGVKMVEIFSSKREPIIKKEKIQIKNDEGKKTKQYKEVDVVIDYIETSKVTQVPQIYRIQAEAGAVVKMVDTLSGTIAWVGSSTDEAINIQVASEQVSRRIIKDLRKVWREQS